MVYIVRISFQGGHFIALVDAPEEAASVTTEICGALRRQGAIDISTSTQAVTPIQAMEAMSCSREAMSCSR